MGCSRSLRNDSFEYELGDILHPHKPSLTNRGKIVCAYSVCTAEER